MLRLFTVLDFVDNRGRVQLVKFTKKYVKDTNISLKHNAEPFSGATHRTDWTASGDGRSYNLERRKNVKVRKFLW